MAKEIIWAPSAANHLESICGFIAKDSEHYACLFANKIIGLIETIPLFPEAGRVVPEYGNENLREKIYQNYRVVYRIKKHAIEIVAICHGAKILKL